jgi:hypothetical protein
MAAPCALRTSGQRGSPAAASAMVRRCDERLLERVMGIEPTLAAWEAAVLPLNYTRVALRLYAPTVQAGNRVAPVNVVNITQDAWAFPA